MEAAEDSECTVVLGWVPGAVRRALTGLGIESGSSFFWGGGGPAICAGPVGKPPGNESCAPGIWGL